MAEANESPRQKMIGILYLVLLGLAATTITDRVLDAFHNLEISMENTSKEVADQTVRRYESFQKVELKADPVRATPFWERSQKVKKYAEELQLFVDSTRSMLLKESNNNPNKYKLTDSTKYNEIEQRADIDISPRLMITKKRAMQLKEKILETKKKIYNELTPEERAGATIALDAKDPPRREGIKISWEEDGFGDGIPLTAALTALSKLEMDLKSTENSVIRKILSGATKTDIQLDDYAVISVPESKNVLEGQQFKSEIFLTAFSSTLNPEITVGGTNLKVENGKGIYTATASHEGTVKYKAIINMKKADGSFKPFEGEFSYTVTKPSVTISPTKMLVFYVGVPNPVSISAASVGKESLRPTISGVGNGEISGKDGEYVVNVKSPGKVTISVSGELEKGKTTVLGSTEFRCKRLPLPHPQFAGKGGGNMATAQLKSANKLFAPMPPDFDFEAKYTVNSFKLYISPPRGADVITLKSNSNGLSPEMLAELAKMKAGTRLTFDDIIVTGPDGTKATVDPITFFGQ